MKKYLLILMPCLLSFTGWSQERPVSGTVTAAEDGLPIPGVNVVVEGTTKGTATDVDGNYSIQLNEGENRLVFTFVGFKPMTVEVGDRTSIDVALESDVTALEEVVVIGYGTQRKRDVTGAITSLKGEEIADLPNANPLNSIQGRAAGVVITNSGVAGSSPTIRIRGVGSISNTNPLYVVDGIFTDNIDFVNPNDIASMEILKDPSSLAMFGVQGANGVVIITTKRAQKGVTNVNFSSYVGVQKITKKIDVANADQFKSLYNEQLAHLGSAPFDFSNYTADTDWQDLIFRDAMINNNSLSITSGGERNEATFSLNYFKQDGVIKYDSYKRYTAHLRDEYTVNDHLKVGADLSLFRFDRDPYQDGAVNSALWSAPVYAPRDENGNWNAAPTFQRAQVGNPYAFTEIYKDKTISNGYRLVGSLFAEINFLKNFTWKSVFYTDLGFNNSRSYDPLFEIGTGADRAQFNEITKVTQESRRFTTWQMDHTLTFSKNINDVHDITALAGITQQLKANDFLQGGRQSRSPLNIPDDPNFWYLGIGSDDVTRTNNGGAEEQAFLSFLFRLNYSFANKYLLNASFRRDGTSKFSPNNRWGNFPSVGAGWVITEEPFFRDQNVVEFLKIKASWGRLGNDKVGNYLFYPLLNTGVTAVFGENVYPAAVPEYIPNPNIHWEVVQGTDVGFEAVAMDERLSVEFDYYNRETQDILVRLSIPGAVGASQSLTNAGTIVNKGIEVTLGWNDNLGEDLRYNLGANFTTISNEVTSIGDNIGYNITEGPSRTAIGYPIGAFFGYIQDGIFQTSEEVAASAQAGTARPGDIRFRDVVADGIIDDQDRTFIGSPTPDFIYGGSLGLNYGGFEFSLDVQGVAGNEIYKARQTATFAIVNYEANRLGRWVGPGTSDKEPILDNTRSNNFQTSTYFLDPGDYFRIRNVMIAYNFSSGFLDRLNMKNAKVYVNAQNILTFTEATGYTPEVGGDRPVAFGIDNGTYPLPATYSIGVNLSF
jgi:TonB-linked SusC/RagA family outer membrane protein